MTNWISKIAENHPAMARVIEISFYGAILSLLQYIGTALETNNFGEYKVALGMFLTAFVSGVVSGYSSYIRNKKEALESKYNITTQEDVSPKLEDDPIIMGMESGVIDVGESELDFLAGEDIDIKKLEQLPMKDYIYEATDQSYGIYKSACTMMSSYGSILSLFNMESNEDEKKAILDYAVTQGYKIGFGWLTRLGVAAACKVWNEIHSDKKVLFFRVGILSELYKSILKKGYGGINSFRYNYELLRDYRKDGILDGHGFKNYIGGHAIAAYYSNKYSWMHVNTYPRGKYNKYFVKQGKTLVREGTYYSNAYIIVPVDDYNMIELKKKKLIRYIKLLCEKLNLISGTETKKRTKSLIDYFTSVGF